MKHCIALIVCFLYVGFVTKSFVVFGSANQNHVTTCFDGLNPTPHGLCMEQINEPATAVCSGTDDTLQENKCRIRIPKLKRCQEGYTESPLGDCTSFVILDPTYFCPMGFEDNDNVCIQRVPGEIKTMCNEGRLDENKCMLEHIVGMEEKLICPDGSALYDNSCWKVVDTFDCTGQFDCDRKCVLDNSCRSHGTRSNGGRRGLHDVTGLVPVSAPRPVRISVVKQMCDKKIEVPPIITRKCPSEYVEISDTQCSRQLITAPISICVETNGPVDSCPDIVRTAEKQSRCGEGTVTLPHGKCKRVNTVPGLPYCPPDFVSTDDSCVAYVKAPLRCPPDLTLQKDRCVGTRYYSAVTVDTESFKIVADSGSPSPAPNLARPLMKKGRTRS